jgi:hypothetical protein
MIPLERETRVVVSPDAVSAELEGETVILGMHDGVYYGLDLVGSRIWGLAASPATLGSMHATIVAEYDVAPEVAWTDLCAVVRDLLAAGLLVLATDP